MALAKEKKEELVGKFKRAEQDTGSPEVQVALLTERIITLTQHFKTHHKDHHSRQGLFVLVNKRKKLLGYLKNKDHGRYRSLIKALGLRK